MTVLFYFLQYQQLSQFVKEIGLFRWKSVVSFLLRLYYSASCNFTLIKLQGVVPLFSFAITLRATLFVCLSGRGGDQRIWLRCINPNSCHTTKWPSSWSTWGCSQTFLGTPSCVWQVCLQSSDRRNVSSHIQQWCLGAVLLHEAFSWQCSSCSSGHVCCNIICVRDFRTWSWISIVSSCVFPWSPVHKSHADEIVSWKGFWGWAIHFMAWEDIGTHKGWGLRLLSCC